MPAMSPATNSANAPAFQMLVFTIISWLEKYSWGLCKSQQWFPHRASKQRHPIFHERGQRYIHSSRRLSEPTKWVHYFTAHPSKGPWIGASQNQQKHHHQQEQLCYHFGTVSVNMSSYAAQSRRVIAADWWPQYRIYTDFSYFFNSVKAASRQWPLLKVP